MAMDSFDTRREFLGKVCVGAGILLGAPLILSACGHTDANGGYPNVLPQVVGGDCRNNGTLISIEMIHTPNHTCAISKHDVNLDQVVRSYTLEDNGAGHTHTISISEASFSKLKLGEGIQVTSDEAAGHVHLVTVNCSTIES
jgi:hypothetical protein